MESASYRIIVRGGLELLRVEEGAQ